MTDIDKIYKQFGVNPKTYMTKIIDDQYDVIPVSPHVDASCGGGIKSGSIVIISGPEKLGKTTLCLQIIANAQKMGKDRNGHYIDAENRLQKRDVEGINGLITDPSRLSIVGPEDGVYLTGENALSMVETLVNTQRNSVIVLDSLDVLATKKELEYNFGDNVFVAGMPRLNSIFCRKMAQTLRDTGNILCMITHKHANIGGMGNAKKKNDGGGTKLKYAANYKFDLKYKQEEFDGAHKIGHKVYFSCEYSAIKTPFSASQNLKHFYHTFGYGIDNVKEICELAVDLGVVARGGSWYTVGEEKMQGLNKAQEYLKANPKILDDIQKQCKEMMDAS